MSTMEQEIKARVDLSFSREGPPLRHRCRNTRCGCGLRIPTDVMRDAFCCRGCFTSFYRSRCIVCEKKMERTQESQTTCGRPKCRAALRRDRAHFLGKWGDRNGQGTRTPGEAERTLKTSIKTVVKTARDPDPHPDLDLGKAAAWYLVAGPPIERAEALHLVTLGDERILQLEREQKALTEARLHNPDRARAAEREKLYVATVRRFRDRGYGKPVAAAAVRILTDCSWEPCEHPADDFPELPAFLCRRQ
jgi:hypothetical protein